MIEADESLNVAAPGSPPKSGPERRAGPGNGGKAMSAAAEAAATAEEVSDQEAETLMMKLDVDRKVAQRQAHAARRRRPDVTGPVVTPPVVDLSFTERWRWQMIGGVGACLALFLGVALALL